MGSRRAGRGLKRSLEAVGFILAEFELKRSHGDPIRDNFYGFWTRELAQLCLRESYLRLRETHQPTSHPASWPPRDGIKLALPSFRHSVDWWGLPTRLEWALAPDRGAGVT